MPANHVWKIGACSESGPSLVPPFFLTISFYGRTAISSTPVCSWEKMVTT